MARIIRERMSLQDQENVTPDGPRELAHHLGGDPELLRQLAAVAVHGPDEPAGRADEQAPPLGTRTRRPHARPRRLRGARRPLHPLRPRVPDRDAGRPEHRPHLVALDVRARQRVRLPRDAVLPGDGRRRWTARSRSSSRPTSRTARTSRRRTRRSTRSPARSTRTRSPCGTAASTRWSSACEVEYMDVSPIQLVSAGGGADPVPRARRREPRADGLQHAAPGRAAAADRGAARRHRSRGARSRWTRARWCSPAVPAWSSSCRAR